MPQLHNDLPMLIPPIILRRSCLYLFETVSLPLGFSGCDYTSLFLNIQPYFFFFFFRKSIDDKWQVDLILLDFLKAFDCVPRECLLSKLEYYSRPETG